MGPGGGTRKFGLPEAQTDYIFSVIGEEFGLIACLAVALLYLAIVARVLIKLLDEENSFAILAAAGLVIQFGLQALINMAVNVQIAPSKGILRSVMPVTVSFQRSLVWYSGVFETRNGLMRQRSPGQSRTPLRRRRP